LDIGELMPSAEIITIGTELLLGEIFDTNTRYLARALRDAGIDLYRTTTVGDNINRIAQAIQEALTRSEIIITTGGLGPTVDDPTRLAVAQAVGAPLEYRPDLWDQIQERFRRYGRTPGENNRRQAYIPSGAIPIENPVGTAPAFIYEVGKSSIACLPGVPKEMEYLLHNAILPYLKDHFQLKDIIKAMVMHTVSMGESMVDELIGDLETLSNPTVGLLAHPGQTDIRVTAKAASVEEADRMIAEVAQDLRQRLGFTIYGVDQETLEQMTIAEVQKKGVRVSILEAGLNGSLIKRLVSAGLPASAGEMIQNPLDSVNLFQHANLMHQNQGADLTIGASLIPGDARQDLVMVLITPGASQEIKRSYGGPPLNALSWAVNNGIDLLRRYLLEN
jgi:nicotinamide-nucleotide amidase